MNYRALGRTGLKVSALGFGCMRLPMDGPKVDDRLAIPLLQRAVELGVTYFDTAVGYCQEDSQRALGDALQGLRHRVVLSTKNPVRSASDIDEWWRNLENSLRLLQTDYIDIYNVHGLSWDAFDKGFRGDDSVMGALLMAREQGLIRHLCCSTHDTPQNVIKLAEENVFESITLQYNLLNRSNEPAIAYLKEKNVGVVVMGPVGGGRLAKQTVEGGAGGATSAQLALKFVLSNPGVTIALSGMCEVAMLEENAAVASEDLTLSREEAAEVNRAGAAQAKLLDYYCTACGYCMPCPSGVNVPENFTLAQLDQAYGMTDLARTRYVQIPGRARFCLECGTCLEKCPQTLDIPKHLKAVVDRLDPDAGRPAVEAEIRSISQADGGLKIEMLLKPLNLTSDTIEGELTAEAGGVELLRRAVTLKPRTHKPIRAEGVVRPEAARGTIAYQAAFEGGGAVPSCRGECKALFAHSVSPGQPVTPDQALIHGVDRVASGNKALTATHRTCFRVAHDEENFILAAEVDEDLAGPGASDDSDGAHDCLQMYLDCRPEGAMRRGPYEDGCALLTLMPGLKGGGPGIEVRKADAQAFRGCAVKSSAREGGYRIEARIPLAALNLPDGQQVFGFDLAQLSAGPDGKTDLMLVWAGDRSNRRETKRFGLVCLA